MAILANYIPFSLPESSHQTFSIGSIEIYGHAVGGNFPFARSWAASSMLAKMPIT